MTTNIMRDSIVGDSWIQQTMQNAPLSRIINPDTGQPTGDILTGPVRLSFIDLIELPQKKPGDSNEPKYKATLLFPPGTDFSILYEEYYKICGQTFPEYYDAQTGQYHGLTSPFRSQSEKLKFPGYTPDCVFMNVSSRFKPAIVDTMHNPIVDPSRVYPGVWAICAINAYGYGKNPPQPKKGINFGIQNVMIIGDDTKLAGGGPDPKKQFAGVQVNAPVTRPNFAGMPPQGHGAAPAAAIPGYTSAGGGVAPRPPAHAPAGFTQTGTAIAALPPSGGQPYQHYAPPATISPSDDDMSFLS